MAAILNFGSRTTSGNVRGDTVKLGMVDNVGIAIGIAAPSLAVQKLFQLPVSAGRHLEFWWSTMVYHGLPTSVNLRQCPQCQVEVRRGRKLGVAFEIASQSPTVQQLFLLPA